MSHPRVLIVEDHPLMADALRVHLQRLLPQMVCIHAHSLQQGLICLQQSSGFSLVMLDLNLPDSQGLDTLNAFCGARPVGLLVVLTAMDDSEVVQACMANNVSYISKSAHSFKLQAELLAALSKVHQMPAAPGAQVQAEETSPHPVDQLSNKQRLILALLAQGHSNIDIAASLNIAETTVRSHMTEIYHRLGVKNRTQASTRYVLWTQQHGIGNE
jgi:DNA-binding NarL/FixJ family response regulator